MSDALEQMRKHMRLCEANPGTVGAFKAASANASLYADVVLAENSERIAKALERIATVLEQGRDF